MPRSRHSLEAFSRAVAGGGMTPATAAYRLLGYLDSGGNGTSTHTRTNKGD